MSFLLLTIFDLDFEALSNAEAWWATPERLRQCVGKLAMLTIRSWDGLEAGRFRERVLRLGWRAVHRFVSYQEALVFISRCWAHFIKQLNTAQKKALNWFLFL